MSDAQFSDFYGAVFYHSLRMMNFSLSMMAVEVQIKVELMQSITGVGIINYTGHGSIDGWGNGSSLNNAQINQLTNVDKLPFVITVGCNVGEFNSTNECFSEAWRSNL